MSTRKGWTAPTLERLGVERLSGGRRLFRLHDAAVPSVGCSFMRDQYRAATD
jgi:hypothetical protein